MSHYTFHNISETSQKGSVMAINTLGHAAEAFLFIYLGIGIYTTDQETFRLDFTLYIICGGFIARAAAVFIPLGIFVLIKKCSKKSSEGMLSVKQMLIIWFSGLIRGAIAFALSLKISSEVSKHKEALISITLIVVLMTTIILGGLMAAFAKLIGLSAEGKVDRASIIQRESMLIPSSNQKTALERADAGWLQKRWRLVDDKYIKKIFGGDLHKRSKSQTEKAKNDESDEYTLPAFGEDTKGRESQMIKFAQIARAKEEDKVNFWL